MKTNSEEKRNFLGTDEWKNIFDKPKRIIAFIFSGCCLLVVLLRIFIPKLLFDQYSLILLGIGFLPWLTLFFSKINFPGGGGVETRAQGVSMPKAPPIDSKTQPDTEKGNEEEAAKSIEQMDKSKTGDLSSDAKKILATLWRYQQQSFKNDFSKRWTFLIYPGSAQFIEYINGLGELLKYGYVSVRSDNSQVMLTNEGIYYIQHHKEIQVYEDYYIF
jgi:hypothetical protein